MATPLNAVKGDINTPGTTKKVAGGYEGYAKNKSGTPVKVFVPEKSAKDAAMRATFSKDGRQFKALVLEGGNSTVWQSTSLYDTSSEAERAAKEWISNHSRKDADEAPMTNRLDSLVNQINALGQGAKALAERMDSTDRREVTKLADALRAKGHTVKVEDSKVIVDGRNMDWLSFAEWARPKAGKDSEERKDGSGNKWLVTFEVNMGAGLGGMREASIVEVGSMSEAISNAKKKAQAKFPKLTVNHVRTSAFDSERRKDAEFPYSVKFKGKTYHRTGKTGTEFKTGKQSMEYANKENNMDSRVWQNEDGKITED